MTDPLNLPWHYGL